jgi:hypothetical protein
MHCLGFYVVFHRQHSKSICINRIKLWHFALDIKIKHLGPLNKSHFILSIQVLVFSLENIFAEYWNKKNTRQMLGKIMFNFLKFFITVFLSSYHSYAGMHINYLKFWNIFLCTPFASLNFQFFIFLFFLVCPIRLLLFSIFLCM